MARARQDFQKDIDRIREEAMKRFDVSFALMAVIPLLASFYLITVRFFSIDILQGTNGIYLLLILLIGFLGLIHGRSVIQRLIQKLVGTSERLETLVEKESALNLQLKEEIRERQTAEENLKEAQNRLIQAAKMESVGELAAGTAHEVKNPLAMLMMGVDYLKESVESRDKETAYMLSSMDQAIRRADSVIMGLLDYATKPDLKLVREPLYPVIEQSLALVKHALDKSHVRVAKHYAPHLTEVLIERNQMQQVFVNLLVNAIQAMPKGGELSIRTYAGAYETLESLVGKNGTDAFRPEEPVVAVAIEDTGSGIPEAALNRIFDPFFTTRRDTGGTGLGLSIIQNIVERHRGLITIANKKDRGTRVTLILRTEEKEDG